MTDIHTHILPGMDDGAKDVQEAKEIIALLKKQGISLAVLTPHYYPYNERLTDFLERRERSYQSIGNCDLDMLLASETYLSESLFDYDSIEQLIIPNTRYLLLELPSMEKWSSTIIKQINRIIAKYNIKPIISHVERYEPVKQKKEAVLQELVSMGCLLQFNIDSLIERKTQSSTVKYIRGGWADFVGSDCHNLSDRPPRFDLFKEIMRKRLNCEWMQNWSL